MVDRSVLAVANEFGLIVSMLLNLSTSKCKNIITFKTFSTNFLNKLHDLRLSAAHELHWSTSANWDCFECM